MRAIVIVILLLASACATTSSNLRRCPDSPEMPCLTGEECSIDEELGCERCRCAEPYGVHEQQPDPIGPASPE